MKVDNSTTETMISEAIDYAKQHLPDQYPAELFAKFTKLFLSNMSGEDISEHTIVDLYGATVAIWELMYIRRPKECKVQILNPHYEQLGWQSTHTILQIAVNDMPFVIDTIRMEIERLGLTAHLIVHSGGIKVKRNRQHQIVDLIPFHVKHTGAYHVESPIQMEIDRITDSKLIDELQRNVKRVIKDVRVAVQDWQAMKDSVTELIDTLNPGTMAQDADQVREAKSFLEWLLKDHFTFLGVRDYEVVGEANEQALRLVSHSGLGVLRDHTHSKMLRQFSEMPPQAREIALSSDQILIISKTNTLSTVHRPAYTDYIGVKRFDTEGKLIGERRFIGLYTSIAYRDDPRHIPLLRHKVTNVLKRSGLPVRSHAAKDLLHILATLPRDDLFHCADEELFKLAMGILHLQERRRVRFFARQDIYGRFISCLVYLPRENFNTSLVRRMENLLKESVHGIDVTYSTLLSESVLARIHYLVRVDPKKPLELDILKIEKRLAELAESWDDGFRDAVHDHFGEERGNKIFSRYRNSFPAGYREAFAPLTAIYDISHIENLTDPHQLGMSFYRPPGVSKDIVRFKLFRLHHTFPLSDALPMLENMGLRVIGEQPYQITFPDNQQVWINDFCMNYAQEATFEIDDVKAIFQEAFQKIWSGDAENDSFNRLVLEAELKWREISVLRAYTKYFRQIGFTFSEQYIAATLINNPTIARLLIELFKYRFDPSRQRSDTQEHLEKIIEHIRRELDDVTILDEDRILQRYLHVINATVRTNFYQVDSQGKPKPYLSFKINPHKMPEMPLPLPCHEIYVYSPRFEGVHLRAAKIARGGIRWSDRREDFRTEVLGLMKAQQVKNSVIVPAGAKGGFVPKHLPSGNREAIMREGIACYENFIRGLLDLTDNLAHGDIIKPTNTVCYDDDDPYFVVAADKGTATFSDIANRIAIELNYWMGDAFASGGSTGYDHKKMAITARGAWVSAKRHFQELGVDINQQPITVVGIGDMSGDVFGNGMLLSKKLKLVAAFNHQHIFLDPDPQVELSFQERQRLFNMPRSTWDDYDRSIISSGGGIYSRAAKSIRLSPQIKTLLAVDLDTMEPNQLIRAILQAPVDLLWNGGIGTYIKAQEEHNDDIGDRSNDSVRINGCDVRAQVVCEGGNLGLTQLGRVECELHGCKLNTDFIDNSAGVDCSDHEVNIKILLNSIVAEGDLTYKQRNTLLTRMTREVADLVLENNYHQNLTISIASYVSKKHLHLDVRYIDELEYLEHIDRTLESLPESKELYERRTAGKGLTRPELSILLAYTKKIIQTAILNSELVADPYLACFERSAFPTPLRKRYAEQLKSHYLAQEIIATQLSNKMASEMGITFIYRMYDETGASIAEIIKAYAAATEIFGLSGFYDDIQSLDYQVDTDVQYKMLLSAMRLVRRATRWLLRNRRENIVIVDIIDEFSDTVRSLYKRLPKLLLGADKQGLEDRATELTEQGAPADIAQKISGTIPIYHALNIIEAATAHDVEVFRVAKIYFMLVDRLDLLWFRDQINAYPVSNHWSVLAKANYKGDLDWAQRELTVSVLLGTQSRSIPGKINEWFAKHQAQIKRWQAIIADMHGSQANDFAILFVALRELLDLSEASTALKTVQHTEEHYGTK